MQKDLEKQGREQKIDVSSTRVKKKHAGSMSKIFSKRPIIRETCAAVCSAKMKQNKKVREEKNRDKVSLENIGLVTAGLEEVQGKHTEALR